MKYSFNFDQIITEVINVRLEEKWPSFKRPSKAGGIGHLDANTSFIIKWSEHVGIA